MLDLVRCFSEEFLLQTSCSVSDLMMGFSCTPDAVLVSGFSYTPGAIFSEKFLIQSSCCFRLVRFFFPFDTSCDVS